MKRFLAIVAALAVSVSAMADEGMWLLPLLNQMNKKDLKAAGCKLSPEEIYSINKSSLKDAIVQFGGGCTAEIISGSGLLVTNHHCGYSNIQALPPRSTTTWRTATSPSPATKRSPARA